MYMYIDNDERFDPFIFLNYTTLDDCRADINEKCSDVVLGSCYNSTRKYPDISTDHYDKCYNEFEYPHQETL